MGDMNNLTLPPPNPNEWATRSAVAAHLGVDPVTVYRWSQSGKLTGYQPRTAGSERAVPVLFWWPEVLELHAARLRVTGRA